jgi:hypothetical protein
MKGGILLPPAMVLMIWRAYHPDLSNISLIKKPKVLTMVKKEVGKSQYFFVTLPQIFISLIKVSF